MIAELPFIVLKGRLAKPGAKDLDRRTLRIIGRYSSFDRAVDAAVAACRAYRTEEDATLFRYKVTTETNCPPSALTRVSPRTPRGER